MMNELVQPDGQQAFSWRRFPIWVAWTNLVLIGFCYLLINFYQYSGEKSSHYFHVDVAFHQGHVMSLQQNYQLFPKSHENLREHYKYHYFDTHVKYWLAKLFGLNGAFLAFSVAGLIAIVWLIAPKPALLIAVPVMFFAHRLQDFPFDLDVSLLSAGFIFDSDFIDNHNNIAGLIILLLWARLKSPWFRYPTAFLVGFIELPMVAALAGLVILEYVLYREKPIDKAVTLALIIVSYFIFKSNVLDVEIVLEAPSLRNLEFLYQRYWWLVIIVAAFFWYLRLQPNRVRWFDTVVLVGLLLLPALSRVVEIWVLPKEYHFQDNIQMYQWVFLGVAVFCLSRMDTPKDTPFITPLSVIKWGFTPVMIVSIAYFGAMAVALAKQEFHRMGEHLDNRELIEITKNIENDGVVGLNFIDNPRREGRQLQVVGLIPNQLFVSNLYYGKSSPKTKAQLYQDWEDIQKFTAKGKPDLSDILMYLLIQKDKPNYDRAVIEQRYEPVGETENYLLYKRKS